MDSSMLISNSLLLIFAVAFIGCVLATPVVTRIALWAGAIDRPDHFRRIHTGATPRLGGLGLAFGLAIGVVLVSVAGYLDHWSGFAEWWPRQWPVLVAALIVLMVGFVDDTRAIGPRAKLLGQALAVIVLYLGGVRIEGFDVLGLAIELGHPSVAVSLLGHPIDVALPGLFITMFWLLGCMNIWNLIDGMDGLASGVGLLVSATLTLVAIHNQNVGVAILASALAGSLAGFLLYNWHPACIFLGDSGSLLIGLLIGIIGVQGSFKGPSAISILFPILAMGLPISDTAMAIFRRWVRELPLSSADRRHVHHLLIGLGLNPKQAALLLYCFSGFLCGVVLLGVAFRNEVLALILGISGCLAFLLILTSRLDELSSLRGDFRARMARGRQERCAARVTWEAIQRMELCDRMSAVCQILEETSHTLGCTVGSIACVRDGHPVALNEGEHARDFEVETPVSGSSAIFRLSSGQDLMLTVSLHQGSESTLAADIAFRFLQRLAVTTAERLEQLLVAERGTGEATRAGALAAALGDRPQAAQPCSTTKGLKSPAAPVLALSTSMLTRSTRNWLRVTLGWEPRPMAHHPSLGEE
jgi:UDP-GlcNAc:undecaprenyl-phosphate/decaprenyl-phosphate GlcNAc-1-phosphate transferase